MLATSPAPRRESFAPDRSPNQSALTSRPTATNPSSSVRHTPRSPRETKSRRGTNAAPKQPDASLEVFFPFSAFQPRCAARGGQASGQSRFGVFSPVYDPRVRGLRTPASPLRFFALRMRCGTARRADLGRLRFCNQIAPHQCSRYTIARKSTCLWSPVQAPVGETDQARSRATRHIKRHRFANFRCLSRVMHRRVPWRGVPLPSGSSLRGLVGRVVLPSCSPGGAHGVHTLRRFDPADG